MNLLKSILSFLQSLRLVESARDAREQYLAGASNLVELEQRQRSWDRGFAGPLRSW